MRASPNRIKCQRDILELSVSGKVVDAKELAEKHSISHYTVYNYIKRLKAMGVSIQTPGRGSHIKDQVQTDRDLMDLADEVGLKVEED